MNLPLDISHFITGWSVTEPSAEFIQFVNEAGITKPMDINRDGATVDVATLIGLLGGLKGNNGVDGQGMPIAKKKTSTRNWICPCCGAKLRTTKADMNIICGDCMENFVMVEK